MKYRSIDEIEAVKWNGTNTQEVFDFVKNFADTAAISRIHSRCYADSYSELWWRPSEQYAEWCRVELGQYIVRRGNSLYVWDDKLLTGYEPVNN